MGTAAAAIWPIALGCATREGTTRSSRRRMIRCHCNSSGSFTAILMERWGSDNEGSEGHMSMGDCVCGWNESEGLRTARSNVETVSRRERCVRCAVGFDKTRHSSQFPRRPIRPRRLRLHCPRTTHTHNTPTSPRPPAPRCTLPQFPDSLTPLSGTLGAATPQYRRYTHGARVQRRSVQQARAHTQHNTTDLTHSPPPSSLLLLPRIKNRASKAAHTTTHTRW